MMRAPVLAFALAGFTSAFGASASAGVQVTEQSVHSLADTIEAAARANDTGEANTYLAGDCVFHVTAPDSTGRVQTRTMTRQQYVDDQAKAKSEGVSEVYKSTTPVVAVKDGKATATVRATDSQVEAGKSVTTVSDQVETFGLRDGRLMVTAVDVTVVSVTVDGQRLY